MFAKKLEYVSDEVMELCIARFVEACKYKHAMAFFQWREKFGAEGNSAILHEVFQNRVDYLKNQSQMIEKNLAAAERSE